MHEEVPMEKFESECATIRLYSELHYFNICDETKFSQRPNRVSRPLERRYADRLGFLIE